VNGTSNAYGLMPSPNLIAAKARAERATRRSS
jgi:hypothetical protein